MLAPIVLFVYARLDHTKETIGSLVKNYLAKDTKVFIYSDAAADEKKIQAVEQVRDYVDSLEHRRLFKSVNVIKAETNKGLAKSIISGVTEIIEQYGKVIVVEDDLVSSPDFLEYMNAALDFYESNKGIWSISGYTFKVDIPQNYKSDVYLSYRGCSWGWATWSDRWNMVDWDVQDYAELQSNKKLRSKFNRGGLDMADMLDAQMQGKIDSWAIRWCYAQSKLDTLTVYPVVSRIKNIGLDGTGTHSGITKKYDAILLDGKRKCVFDKPELEPQIIDSFKNHFGTELDFFVVKMKRLIKKILLMK